MPMPDALILPAGTVTRFVGDVHLGDGGRNDVFGAKDDMLLSYLRDCGSACDAVVFMGDMIDLAQGWRARRVLNARTEVARTIASLSERVQVVFVRGNHDWSVDYEAIFPRARACERVLIGDIGVWHGHQHDSRCDPSTRSYQAQMVVHNLAERACGFEFRTPLHEHDTRKNRVAHWLGHRYAMFLRAEASLSHRWGLDERADRCDDFVAYWSRSVWGDPHNTFRSMAAAVRDGPYRAIVCGHTHLPGVVDVGGRQYVNAGSWAFGAAEAATWDGSGFSLCDVRNGIPIGDEHYRWMLSDHDPGDFFDWWAQHYRGRLRFGPPIPAAESQPRPARVPRSTTDPLSR